MQLFTAEHTTSKQSKGWRCTTFQIRLLRSEPHSFLAISQLEFSSNFLEGVCAVFAGCWILQSQLCFYRCRVCARQNNQNCCVKTSNQVEYCYHSRVLFKIYENKQQQQQASRANVMHNMDVLIKLLATVSGSCSSIIIRLLLFESAALRVQSSHVKKHKEHIRHMKFIIHMHIKKNQPILVRVL